MKIEFVISKLLEIEMKGGTIYHYFDNNIGINKTCVLYSPTLYPFNIFRHSADKKAEKIPVNVTLHEAVEIVKTYWDRRIEL